LNYTEGRNLTTDEMEDWKKDLNTSAIKSKIWNNKTAYEYYNSIQ
jgi:hypothetical protein